MTNFYRHGDSPSGADFFCGSGGASQGVIGAGIDLKFAANHDAVAIATHSHLHPNVDHYQVDLLDYDVGKMPRVAMAHFSPSCKHHSQANARKVYEKPGVLAEFVKGTDGYEEARSGYANSERSRVTMSCVLRYADVNKPDTMIVENVVEAAKWGPNRDGATFRWWLGELDRLGYEYKPMFLNSVAFGVPQSRDRMFVVCWRKGMRRPNLDHWSSGWCPKCEQHVKAFQFFRKPTATWALPEWGKLGKQYDYLCESCCGPVNLHESPIASVLDFNDLGTRLGDRDKPLAASTMGRIQRYLDMHEHRLPFVTLTRSAEYGSLGWRVDGPMGTMTTRNDMSLVSPYTAAQVTVYGNTMERDGSTCRGRGLDQPTWSQHTTESTGLAFHGGLYEYQNRTITGVDGIAPTMTCHDAAALISGAIIPMRQHTLPSTLDRVTHTQTSDQAPGLAIGAMFAKNNGQAHDTKYHPVSDPSNTLTAHDTTSLVTGPIQPVNMDDVRFRMLKVAEIRGAMAYSADWEAKNPDGTTPTKRDQIRLLGDGVTPPVLTWLTERTLEIMG